MKKQSLFLSLFFIPLLCLIQNVYAGDKLYTADWESLVTHPVPQWFKDAKFGLFIHWGVYSVPGWGTRKYAEHYPQFMYHDKEFMDYHQKTYGTPPEFGYKDFIPLFKAENWNPDEWARLFKQIGVKYVIATAEHHDGFAMWDSELTKWDAKDMGPHRDLIGDLTKAIRKHGLKCGLSYHRERHYWFFRKGRGVDPTAEPFPGVQKELEQTLGCIGLYGPFHLTENFIADYKNRWQEIQNKYKPDFMWLDDIPSFRWNKDLPIVKKYKNGLKEMIANYLNTAQKWGKEVYLNNKGRVLNFPPGLGCLERDYMNVDSILTQKWQNPSGMAHSYGFDRNEEREDRYKSVDELVDLLIDVVSKNGNLLLNIGPKSDGTISDGQRKRLLGIGKWLEVNGEAIYGTHPWKKFGEDNFRFTTKNDRTLYAIALEWIDQPVLLNSFQTWPKSGIQSIHLLGGNEKIDYKLTENGLLISLPAVKSGEHAFVFKIKTSKNLSDLN